MTTNNTQDETQQAQAAKAAPAPKTNSEVSPEQAKIDAAKAELLQLEIEAKRLEVLEKKANLEDLQDRLSERQLKREAIKATSVTNGETLKALAEQDQKVQKRCNHRKGGNGAAGIIGGQGDSLDYAVIKHTMLNSDMWVRCQRCGKTWKPPVRNMYASDELYLTAVAEYEAAKNFPTKNSPSSSYQFRFSDNGAYFREVTKNTTLR